MLKTQIKLDSLIFDKAKREQALSNAVGKTIREFSAYVPKQQIEGKASGKLYARKGGASFRRSHRASARGERPAPDSGKLSRSTRHAKTGLFTGEVTTVATEKGFDYASHLENKMDRPIQNAAEDIQTAQQMLNRNVEAALAR